MLLVMAACGYSPARTAPGDGAPGDTAMLADTPADTNADAAIDAPPAAPCNQDGTADVRLCFKFENNLDEDGPHGYSIQGTGHQFVAGFAGLGVDTSGSTIEIAQDSALNVTELTIRVHLRPNAIIPVSGTRQGVIENDAWRMHVMPGGGIRCALNDGTTELNLGLLALAAQQFTRVACTYDGTLLRVFYNGTLMGSALAAVEIRDVGTPTTIGQSEPADGNERFQGVIDNLEVFGSLEAP